jgi:hypothetical protein
MRIFRTHSQPVLMMLKPLVKPSKRGGTMRVVSGAESVPEATTIFQNLNYVIKTIGHESSILLNGV